MTSEIIGDYFIFKDGCAHGTGTGEPNCETDEHSYGKQQPRMAIYGTEGSDHVAVVCIGDPGKLPSYSIIKVDFKGKKPFLKCSTCWTHKTTDTKCQHTDAILSPDHYVSDVTSCLQELLNKEPKWRSKYIPVPVSTTSIPFSPAPEEQKMNRRDLTDMVLEDGFIHFVPDLDGHCVCGGDWGPESELESTNVVCSTDMVAAKVYIRQCSRCEQFKDYDGLGDQVLNMGLYLVTHELLRRYLRQFVTEGTTLIAFYQELCWQQIESGNVEVHTIFPYNRFRYAWYGFLSLLDVNYSHGFACQECGDNPETVVMDGVSLGVRKSFMPWKNFLNNQSTSTSLDGSSHNMRVFTNNAYTRNLLAKFILKELDLDEFKDLVRCITLYQPALLPFFQYFTSITNTMKCPDVLQDLFRVLCSNYPVCGFIHYHEYLFDLLLELSNGVDISSRMSDTILIQKECPILANLFQHYKWNCPEYIRPVLVELVKKANFPFVRTPHDLKECSDRCYCSGEGFFPTMPKLCHRGEYILDSKTKISVVSCRKRGTTHPSLIPGVFTISCVHGICYGFQLMEDVESPNIPFTLLRTRLHKAPKLVVYDNACNLHNYCLNRDPGFFRDTWFVVDRFHWVNHVGCHSGYNLSCYMQFREINTQVAEQRNATLKKLKSMLSYMNVENFNSHLKLFLWFRSMISLLKLDRNLPVPNAAIFSSLIPVYSRLK